MKLKKSGLQDMKRENARLVMSTILQQEPISRIELSEAVGLSPSTVSALASELLAQGWIVETGPAASTGGRKRTGLSINKDKGYMAVLEVGWRRTTMHLLDMNLDQVSSVQLTDYYVTGNELLEKAVYYLKEEAQGLCGGMLAGIGLLFQEDMNPRDFNVMYSTSLSSAVISFQEALKTQFKVPIIEEYSQIYSFREILKREEGKAGAASAHIEIGKKIFISITSNGNLLDMSEGKKADMTPFVEHVEAREGADRLMEGIVGILLMVSMLFSVETVYLSGKMADGEAFASHVGKRLEGEALCKRRIKVKAMNPEINHMETDLGRRILEEIILGM